ncbi:MAG: acyl-ACP--UDP-N-acetylglucosamine O-acyltransferase [Bacteroidetes bacterium]|nr:acyl-ACP--UDP-N-acetylglucosamine O-acyltransferase [Bacteroidota bacterium]
MSARIHKFAEVSPKAELGNNVEVGPFTVIEEDVVIGDDTVIGSSALVADGARIGKGVKIHHGAVVSTAPQDLKYKGEKTTLIVGDNTVVREFCSLNRGTTHSNQTVIGSDCLLMAYVHVAHDTVVGNKVILANGVQVAGHVEIHDQAIIGGMTPIHQFTKVGAHVMVGGGFRITKDVPPYVLAGREPLTAEGLNLIGLRRRGFSRESIEALDKAFMILYRRGLNVSDALKAIEAEVTQLPEVAYFVEFIRKCDRGIIRGPK